MKVLTRTLIGKVLMIMGVMIIAVIAMIVVSFNLSANVVTNIQTLQAKDIGISTETADAYSSFLTMDDQSNMWVGLYSYHDKSLSDSTLQQILQAEQQLNQSLVKLKSLVPGSSGQALVKKAEQDAAGYEAYFSQVQKLNSTDHQKAQHIMYIDNSNVSNALTADLQQLKELGKQRVETNALVSIHSSTRQERMTLIGGTVVALLGIGLLGFIYLLLKPVNRIVRLVRKVAKGDLTIEEIRVRNKDEIGLLADGVNQMVQNLRTMIAEVGLNAEQVAASSEQLMASAEQTSQATEHIATSIQEVAAGSESQAVSTDTAVTTMAEIASATGHIAVTANQVAETAEQATQLAAEGQSSLQQVTSKMEMISDKVNTLSHDVHELGKRSHRIGEIIGVINDIASQTNLLALNAAIEAARAGEHGRGFAVVAEEVRKLAEQSSNSATEIVQVIQSIQDDTGKTVHMTEGVREEVASGMDVVQGARAAFARIQQGVIDVTRQIQEVSAAVEQMSASTDGASQAMQAVSDVAVQAVSSTQNVSAAAEEQLASMEEITASATALARMAEQLQTVIGRFVI